MLTAGFFNPSHLSFSLWQRLRTPADAGLVTDSDQSCSLEAIFICAGVCAIWNQLQAAHMHFVRWTGQVTQSEKKCVELSPLLELRAMWDISKCLLSGYDVLQMFCELDSCEGKQQRFLSYNSTCMFSWSEWLHSDLFLVGKVYLTQDAFVLCSLLERLKYHLSWQRSDAVTDVWWGVCMTSGTRQFRTGSPSVISSFTRATQVWCQRSSSEHMRQDTCSRRFRPDRLAALKVSLKAGNQPLSAPLYVFFGDHKRMTHKKCVRIDDREWEWSLIISSSLLSDADGSWHDKGLCCKTHRAFCNGLSLQNGSLYLCATMKERALWFRLKSWRELQAIKSTACNVLLMAQ